MTIFDEIGLNPDSLDHNVYGRIAKALIQDKLTGAASKFEAASIAAENWLNILYVVGTFRDVDVVYRLLMPTKDNEQGYNLLNSYREHAEELKRMENELAAVTTGPVEWGPFAAGEFPIVRSSATEGVRCIALQALEWLVCPIVAITEPKEQWDAAELLLNAHQARFARSPGEVAALQERIRRERTKLLTSGTSKLPKVPARCSGRAHGSSTPFR